MSWAAVLGWCLTSLTHICVMCDVRSSINTEALSDDVEAQTTLVTFLSDEAISLFRNDTATFRKMPQVSHLFWTILAHILGLP